MPKTVGKRQELLSGEAKLWIILIGVNHYLDESIQDLSYSAIDCQKLADALNDATQPFRDKQAFIYHDFAVDQRNLPTLNNLEISLKELQNARDNDTVIIYFSGHTYLDKTTDRPILCLRDTKTEPVLDNNDFAIIPETGLKVEDLLNKYLVNCNAQQQIVLLDSCHSGGLSFKGLTLKEKAVSPTTKIDNSIPQLIQLFHDKAQNSRGFYGILSCDKQEKSLEFPELGHGLFTYFLIKGLAGEAADDDGIIDADRLYRYVYYRTLEYIDKSNQFIRFYNQQQRSVEKTNKQRQEVPLQTPRRIVEGSGEFLIGLSPIQKPQQSRRVALVINGLSVDLSSIELCRSLQIKGQFEIIPSLDRYETVKENIEQNLSSTTTQTVLIYLRGKVEQTNEGTNLLRLGNEIRLSRDWLSEQLRESPIPQKIVILDCPEATNIERWLKTLKLGIDSQQCIIAAAPSTDSSESFTQTLIDVLSEETTGLTATQLISQLQKQVSLQQQAKSQEIQLFSWISGATGIIDILLADKNEAVFDAGICPYKGLEAFTQQDALFYYGREALRQEILQKLEQTSFLAVVGASGSGKSSLVQAGVLPKIVKSGLYFPQHNLVRNCHTVTLQPGKNPIHALAKALSSLGKNGNSNNSESSDYFEEILFSQQVNGLVRCLRKLATETVIIYIDQFEELFTISIEGERNKFIADLVEALDLAPDKLKVIITLRSDFISSCLDFEQLSSLVKNNHVLVPSILNEKEYREIITKPALSVGLSVEPTLVNRLIEQLQNTKGTLPILQYILQQLWKHRSEGELLLETYEKEIGGLEKALDEFAERMYSRFTKEQKECAKWIFINLVQISSDRKYSRRRIHKSDLIIDKYPTPLIESTLAEIIASKLIVSGAEDNSRDNSVTLEITHEILISHWSKLFDWIESDLSFRIWQQQLNQLLDRWLKNDRNVDALLSGLQLSEARGWLQTRSDDLSLAQREYIQTSIAFKEQEQREKEARIQRELEQQKKARRYLQIGIAASSFIALIATGLGFFANHQRFEAELQRKIANLQVKAIETDNLLSTNPAESLVIAMAALRLSNQFRLEKKIPILKVNLSKAVYVTQEKLAINGHTNMVLSVAFSPDGEKIASASADNTVRVWDLSGNELAQFKGHTNMVLSVAFSPDGEKIASASFDNTVRVWDLSGNELAQFKGHTNSVLSVAFSPDGEKIASASADNTVRVWDLSGNELAQFKGHTNSVTSVAFSPDGEKIASASLDNTVRVWDLSGNELAQFKGHTNEVYSVAFSPNGEKIASASSDKTVRVWDLSGNELAQFKGHTNWVLSVAFSPDGEKIASASADNTVRVWDLSGNELAQFKGHTSEVWSVAFSPNGEKIASASLDKTVRVWDLSGNELAQFKGHTSEVVSVAFSPNGEKIASAGRDKTVRVWRFDWQNLLTLACNQLRYHSLLLEAKTEEALTAGEACLNLDDSYWDNITKAEFQRDRGFTISRIGDYKKGAIDLKLAQDRDSTIDLNPDTKELDLNPDRVAKQLALPAIVDEAIALAKQKKTNEAIALFKKAQKFSPSIDLNPDTKQIETNASAVAKHFSTQE